MTVPRTTPNPATTTRPERSSQKVARKSPLGWLPWALLGALALALALIFLVVNAIDDDGAEGPAGDSLGQVSAEDGESAVGSDGGAEGAAAEAEPPSADELAALSRSALVGGGTVPARVAAENDVTKALVTEPGTAGTVLFDVGSAEIGPAGQEVITAVVASLKELGATRVDVVGHTDVIAGDPTNDPLSQQRADAVAAALEEQLPELEVTASARGQEEPVGDNNTDEGRQVNRRSVISVSA